MHARCSENTLASSLLISAHGRQLHCTEIFDDIVQLLQLCFIKTIYVDSFESNSGHLSERSNFSVRWGISVSKRCIILVPISRCPETNIFVFVQVLLCSLRFILRDLYPAVYSWCTCVHKHKDAALSNPV
jgi:hypothetical protein